MLEELQKQNKLFQEYIKTLEQQIRANTQERQALCKEVNTLDRQNQQLNKRISVQSQQAISQAAIQHLQGKLGVENSRNMALEKELNEKQLLIKQISINILNKDKIIEECQRLMVNNKGKIRQLEISLLDRQKLNIVLMKQLQVLKNENNILRQDVKICEMECKKLVIVNEQLCDVLKKRQQQNMKYRQNEQRLDNKINELSIIIFNLQKSNIDNRQSLSSADHTIHRLNNQLQVSKRHFKQQQQLRLLLEDSLNKLKKEKIQLLSKNDEINYKLQQSIRTIQKLNKQLALFHSQQYKKSHSICDVGSNDHRDVFMAVQNEIRGLNNRQNQCLQKSKQNKLGSSTQWKSIYGKIEILRNTQSMGRFK